MSSILKSGSSPYTAGNTTYDRGKDAISWQVLSDTGEAGKKVRNWVNKDGGRYTSQLRSYIDKTFESKSEALQALEKLANYSDSTQKAFLESLPG